MYDDILGKRKTKPDIDEGICYQCSHSRKKKIQSVHLYCTIIHKYVHKDQQSCLQFKRRKLIEGW